MGKHRFRLSDLTPNSWFYKLKDMSKSNTSHTTSMNKWNYNTQAISVTPKPIPSQPYLPNIVSYYLSTNDKPNKLPIKTNPKAIDIPFPIDRPKKINPNSVKKPAKSSFSSMPKTPPYDRDIYTEEDMSNNSEIKLRPIRTKGLERENLDDQPCSPRLRSRRLRVYKTRNPALRGFAVVKASFDPQRDFRESMMEMITENGIRNPKDLEELLTCYLMLNSMEYHGIIVKVFENIWIELDC